MLENLDRETYLGYLELDYYKRMKEEYKDELGLFGRVDAPKFVSQEELEAVGDKLETYLSNKLETYMEDNKILKDIDEEIK